MVADLTWKIPDNIPSEQAATVLVGLYSAAMCMTHPKRLNMTEWPNKVSDEQWVSNACRWCPRFFPLRRFVDPLTSGARVLARSFASTLVVFGLQRVYGRRALRCSVGSFIWIQSGYHGFAREPRDAQKSWC